MTNTTRGGRGRQMALTASAVVVALGLALVAWVFTHQTGEPPTPAAAATAESSPSTSEPETTSDAAETTAGPEESGQDASASTAAPSESSATAAPEPTKEPEPTQDPEPEVAALPESQPTQVRIPAIDVNAPLQTLGLDDEGLLEVPSGERYGDPAWYDGSPTPGEIGPSVIEGHVTARGGVASVFFELGALTDGDRIEVDRQDGTTATFEVYRSQLYDKENLPPVEVFGNTDEPELRVITCGGPYDAARGRHADNVVVYARYVDEA